MLSSTFYRNMMGSWYTKTLRYPKAKICRDWYLGIFKLSRRKIESSEKYFLISSFVQLAMSRETLSWIIVRTHCRAFKTGMIELSNKDAYCCSMTEHVKVPVGLNSQKGLKSIVEINKPRCKLLKLVDSHVRYLIPKYAIIHFSCCFLEKAGFVRTEIFPWLFL